MVLNPAPWPNRSLDHLVGSGAYRWRNGEAERLRRLHVDDKLEDGRLHDGQVGGLFTLENPPGINACLSKVGPEARPIADEATGCSEFAPWVDRRNGKAFGECRDLLPPIKKKQ